LGKRQDVVEGRLGLLVRRFDLDLYGIYCEHGVTDVGRTGALFDQVLNVLPGFPVRSVQSLEGLSAGGLAGFDRDDLRFGQTQGFLESFQTVSVPLSFPGFRSTLEAAVASSPTRAFLSHCW
jgi:hypothetical protein